MQMTHGSRGVVPPASRAHLEAEAARVALTGRPSERLRLAVESIRGLLTDPEQTHYVFCLGMVTSAPYFPRFLARFALTPDGERLLREQPAIDGRAVAALAALPPNTLGGAYARFLEREGLDPDVFRPTPELPPTAQYVSQRLRQTHDLWHVLTGYDTSVSGELALQAFYYGQTHLPAPALIAIFGALRFGSWREPMLQRLVEGYRRGKAAEFLPPISWEDHWEEDLDEVRNLLQIRS